MTRFRVRCALLASLLVLSISATIHAQLSGHVDVNLIGRRIPTTVSGEIKLDTPSVYTMFELAFLSELDLTLETGLINPRIQAAVNTAGIEHAVLSSPLEFGDIPVFDLRFDNVRLTPEVWIAVPFENVLDVNNLPNSAMIPPGNPLLVSARAIFETRIGGFNIQQLFMLEDVNFPSPSGDFEPLTYDRSDQDFSVGSLLKASWRASIGWSMSAQLGLSASSTSKAVRGYSALGRVTPDSSFARLGVSGIPLATLSLFGVGSQAVTLSTTLSGETGGDASLNTTISMSGPAWEGTSIGSSISFATSPPTVSQILLSFESGPFKVGIALDTLDITGLSASCGDSLNLGPINGSWSFRLSGIERGLTGMAARLSLGQGGFSTDTSVTFSDRGGKLGFASWSTRLLFRFSPAVVSTEVAFGRYGLTRVAVSSSVSF